MKKTNNINFQKYLRDAFERRCLKNPHYSMRAFARDLGVPSANLSNAMNGKRGFSAETLEKMAKKLSLNLEEKKFFKWLCEKDFSRSKKVKEDAEVKVHETLMYESHMTSEKAALVSDWYHLAILALSETKDFQSKPDWIAERLGLHVTVVEQALARLVEANALKIQGKKFVSTGNFFVDPKGIPSRSVREFHSQILKKAEDALEMQNLETREFASVLMCLDKSKMSAAKEKMRQFREEFVREFSATHETSAKEQEVYTVALQLFQMTKN